MDDSGTNRPGGAVLVIVMVVGALVSLAAVVFAVVLLARPADGMQIDDAAVGATVSDSAALYMTLRNDTDSALELVRVSCPCAESVSLHAGGIGEDGSIDMTGIADVSVGAHQVLEFGPGGDHVMLEGLTGPLTEGQSVELELDFADGETRVVQVPVVSLASLAERAADQLVSDDGS